MFFFIRMKTIMMVNRIKYIGVHILCAVYSSSKSRPSTMPRNVVMMARFAREKP